MVNCIRKLAIHKKKFTTPEDACVWKEFKINKKCFEGSVTLSLLLLTMFMVFGWPIITDY